MEHRLRVVAHAEAQRDADRGRIAGIDERVNSRFASKLERMALSGDAAR